MEPRVEAARLGAEFEIHAAELRDDEPWFGELGLRKEDGKTMVVKVGRKRRPDLRILDWRHPFGEAFYTYDVGEEVSLEPPLAKQDVLLLHRAKVAAERRRIRRVEIEGAEGSRELWSVGTGFEERGPSGPKVRDVAGLPDVTALLSPEQYALITSSLDRPVIIQGRAGSGKTTVALYRLSWLAFPEKRAGAPLVDPSKVLVVMFNKALSTFVKRELEPLELDAVQLDTFHGWALAEIRRAYKGRIEARPQKGPDVARARGVKKNVGILSALEAFVTRQIEASMGWMAAKLGPYDEEGWLERVQSSDVPIALRLRRLRRAALEARNQAGEQRSRERLEQIRKIFDTAHQRMTNYKDELLKFLQDQALLGEHLSGVASEDLAALARSQGELQKLDSSARRAGPYIAFEDFALLLRLIQLKNGGFLRQDEDEQPVVYDHLLVDEAQDFGAVELKVLFASVQSRTGVTIVGDLNQKIVPEADFIGWEALAQELGIDGAEVARLEVTHRSSRPIVQLADTLIDGDTPGGYPGPMPTLVRTGSFDSTLDIAAEKARAVFAEQPDAHVCVVAPGPNEAKAAFEGLQRRLKEVSVRRGHNKDFEFAAGVTVTNVRQIKGLEFDAVIVVEPSAERFPDTEQGRRDLYTVLTRARVGLHLVGTEPFTPLLERAIEFARIQTIDETPVVPVEFDEDDDQPF